MCLLATLNIHPPMGRFLCILAFLVFSIAISHATLTSEVYWNTVLPNTPMPGAIRDHLQSGGMDETYTPKNSRNVAVMIGPYGDKIVVELYDDFSAPRPTPRPYEDFSADRPTPRPTPRPYDDFSADRPTPRPTPRPYDDFSADRPTPRPYDDFSGHRPTPRPYDDFSAHRPTHSASPTNPRDELIDNSRIDRPDSPEFFLEKDLHSGAKVKLQLKPGFSRNRFLPREAANAIPFSSTKLPQILSRFSVQKGTPIARMIQDALEVCELPPAPREKKQCSTSLESMVDFVTYGLGTRDVTTLSTVADRKHAPGHEQVYTILSWSDIVKKKKQGGTTTAAACHLEVYPYTVFMCHVIPSIKPYVLEMVGVDGTKVKAVAVCHLETSWWSPEQVALRAFKIKPGTETVCHLIGESDIVWLPKSATP